MKILILILLPFFGLAQEFTLPSGVQREEVTIKPGKKSIYRAIGIMVSLDSIHSLEFVIATNKCWTPTQWNLYVKAWKIMKCACDEKLDVVIDSAGIRKVYKFEDIKHKFICP